MSNLILLNELVFSINMPERVDISHSCLLMAIFQRCIKPIGSIRKKECRILLRWTRTPLLWRYPFIILKPKLGWLFEASLIMSSSSSTQILLNMPKKYVVKFLIKVFSFQPFSILVYVVNFNTKLRFLPHILS